MVAIDYPALCLHTSWALVARNEDELAVTTRQALRRGMYNGLLVVAHSALAYHILGAREVASVGVFGGWNIFLNRRIRVELIPAGDPFVIAVDDLKARTRESFRTWHGWSSAENFEEIEQNVIRATTVPELIDALL